MNDDITNYPLSWPMRQPRTASEERRAARFATRGRNDFGAYGPARKHSVYDASRELALEISRMGGEAMIISTNLKVKSNGLPYSGQRTPDDPGVAVYFEWHDRDLVFACDKWLTVEDNLWAIVRHIDALRGQERWGVGSLDQAFAGYAALPDPDANSIPWWQVLGVDKRANEEAVRVAYKQLAKRFHPDNLATGDADRFREVQQAFETAVKEAA